MDKNLNFRKQSLNPHQEGTIPFYVWNSAFTEGWELCEMLTKKEIEYLKEMWQANISAANENSKTIQELQKEVSRLKNGDVKGT